MMAQRTQVAIVGAGPAGLLLGQLLHRHGIDAVILEARTREYVEARIRAGLLEQGTTDVLREAGVGERLDREGLVHGGIYLNYELIYAQHERGFALHSMRSSEVSRLYVQVDPTQDIADWPDARISEELHQRLRCDGWSLTEGPISDKSITPMRSFVAEPMRYRSLLLAGDAAHIVPPTGAKGLNLAVADVTVLAEAIAERVRGSGTETGLAEYSDRCLERVWRAQHFSWWMTAMLHSDPNDNDYGRRLQRSQLEYVVASRAAATTLAENYVGLPLRTPDRTALAGC
jgi:2-polyprenyl-6-methoxyphenol hydroxylase-like FAD-dependent oxidoreductase